MSPALPAYSLVHLLKREDKAFEYIWNTVEGGIPGN
jgi:hypothetical protein